MDQMDQMDQMKPVNREHLVPNLMLALVVILVPVLGHIILTAIILRDELKAWEKVAWILVIWIVWWVGPFLYLLLGQRRNRLLNFL
jgi:heme/copper-type cytochrome/quinol oxidase subunit 2